MPRISPLTALTIALFSTASLAAPDSESDAPVVVDSPEGPVSKSDAAPGMTPVEEKQVEVTLREWIGTTNRHPEVEFVDVAIEPAMVDGQKVAVVEVYGTVATDARKAAIVARAEELAGVHEVESNLSLAGSGDDDPATMVATGSLLEPNPERKPEAAVIESLLDSPFVDSRDIVVEVTDNGRILLTGTVEDQNEIATAGDVARKTVDMPVDVSITVEK